MTAIMRVGIAAVLAIIEASTMGLTTIWFASSAIVAEFISIAGLPISAQVIVFLVNSIVLLIFTRPIAVKKLNAKTERTNSDSIIGKEVVVTSKVYRHTKGTVFVNGQT